MANHQTNPLPYLPGHSFHDPYKQNFHKTQVFEKKNTTFLGILINKSLEKKYYDEPIDSSVINTLSTLTSFHTSDRLRNRETKLNECYPRILPQWLKYDHKVKSPLTIRFLNLIVILLNT